MSTYSPSAFGQQRSFVEVPQKCPGIQATQPPPSGGADEPGYTGDVAGRVTANFTYCFALN